MTTLAATVQSESIGARRLIEEVWGRSTPSWCQHPLVGLPGSGAAFVEIEEDGEVRSTCVILPRELISAGVSLRVGLIGSVSTHPDYRGRGLASTVLEAAEEALRAQGCVLGLLWADAAGFYQQRGWREFSTEVDFALPAEILPLLPTATGVRRMRADDANALHALYARHDEHCVRTAAENAALLSMPGMEVFVREHEGKPVAYTCCGRGGDLQGVVHEWAGKTEDVLPLLRAQLESSLAEDPRRELFVMLPRAALGLMERLEKLGACGSIGVVGLGKLLDLTRAGELSAACLDPQGRVQARTRQGTVELSGPQNKLTLTSAELFDMLFSARGDSQRAVELELRLGVEGRLLPLAPFVWGLDSI
jgi:GNAT superfamily N-acetyltransferase